MPTAGACLRPRACAQAGATACFALGGGIDWALEARRARGRFRLRGGQEEAAGDAIALMRPATASASAAAAAEACEGRGERTGAGELAAGSRDVEGGGAGERPVCVGVQEEEEGEEEEGEEEEEESSEGSALLLRRAVRMRQK